MNKLNKHVSVLLASGLIGVSGAAQAEFEFSANVAMATDYAFRGISQTDEDPAIQGGFDVSHSSGFYAGVWGSNVDFEIQTVDDAQMELDVYAGFAGNITEKLGFDVGVLHYAYPGADNSLDYDFTEVYGSLSYDFGPLALTGGAAYTDDFITGAGDAEYYYVTADVPLPSDFALSATYGHQDIDKNATFGTPDYNHWSVGVSKEFGGFGFDLTYHDTDMSDNDCFGGSDWCDGRVIFTLSKEM
jgi:uncharacterized protein (TIGR02001 family)